MGDFFTSKYISSLCHHFFGKSRHGRQSPSDDECGL